jgi:hypothetical protein
MHLLFRHRIRKNKEKKITENSSAFPAGFRKTSWVPRPLLPVRLPELQRLRGVGTASSRLKRQRFTDFTGGLQKFTLKNLMLATYIYMYIRKIQTQK